MRFVRLRRPTWDYSVLSGCFPRRNPPCSRNDEFGGWAASFSPYVLLRACITEVLSGCESTPCDRLFILRCWHSCGPWSWLPLSDSQPFARKNLWRRRWPIERPCDYSPLPNSKRGSSSVNNPSRRAGFRRFRLDSPRFSENQRALSGLLGLAVQSNGWNESLIALANT